MERGVVSGLVVFRWAAWMWTAGALVLTNHTVARPGLAAGLLALVFVWSAIATALVRTRPLTLLHPAVVAGELALGALLILADGLVRAPGTAFEPGQSLGSVLPLAAVLTAGVAYGPAGGAAAGAIGVMRALSVVLNGVRDVDVERALAVGYTPVFYVLAGLVAGTVYVRLQRAEDEVARARAREEVARTLHDGVLQTLALVERRAGDPALARLAREQERELREFLFGSNGKAGGDLGAALRRAGGRFEDVHGGRVEVLVPDDLPVLPGELVEAIASAVGEALTNAGKHGHASRVVVYVEVEDGEVFCSVKDNGAGADTTAIVEGVGLSRSIRGRLEELGGRVALSGAEGTGMEVRMWVPR